ncbi:acyltransferase [Cyanobium sp. FGCU-6]|nr:acyltransferase [Cyanobium sp. FGCU6]
MASSDPITSAFRYRPEIDGLRAIAILAVIINHFDKRALPGGFLGVDIFFVISGFVITGSLLARQFDHSTDFYTGFYVRRIKRLWPALIILVAIVGFLICLVNPNPGLSLQTGLASLIGASNLLLYKLQTDYFASSTDLNVFTHTWSLGVEEQFYVVYPFLFWSCGLGRRRQAAATAFVYILAALSLLSLCLYVWLKPDHPDAAFYLMPSRFWEMGLGCLACFWMRNSRRSLVDGHRWLTPLICLLMVGVALVIPPSTSPFATIIAAVSTTILLVSISSNSFLLNFFSTPKLVWVGLLSYSLYLWHWPVLSLSRWTIGIHWWTIPFQLLLIVLIAYGSYRWIEKPLRHATWSRTSWGTFAFGAGASFACAGFLLVLAKPLEGRLFLGSSNRLLDAYLVKPIPNTPICNLFEDPKSVISSGPGCGFSAPAGRPVVYLLGDSHIHQFRSAIASFARSKGAGFVGIWGNACPFPALPSYAFPDNAVKQKCIASQEAVADQMLRRLQPGDLVFIGNYLTAYFTPVSGEVQFERARVDYSRRLRTIAEKFVDKGATVVIYLNAPRFPGLEGMSEGYCYPQWFKSALSPDCRVDARAFLEKRQSDFGWITSWADGKRRIFWDGVDPTTCDGDDCQASHYKDEAHFLDYYAAHIFQRFISAHPHILGNRPRDPRDPKARAQL